MYAKSRGAGLSSTVHITESRREPLYSVPRNTLTGLLVENEANPEPPKQFQKQVSRCCGYPPLTPMHLGVGCIYKNSVIAEVQNILRKTAKDT